MCDRSFAAPGHDDVGGNEWKGFDMDAVSAPF